MITKFCRWDIVYPSRYPESILCRKCKNHFTIRNIQECSHCREPNNVSNIIVKIRPLILWVNQDKWFNSMAFGIPLSTSGFYSDTFNHAIKIEDCTFFQKDKEKPMRALIFQATRVDGNVLHSKTLIGKLSSSKVKSEIENKLLEWIFGTE